jgi:membrane protease YdiL (CAAX protease family)
MNMKPDLRRDIIRPIAFAIVFSTIGFLLIVLIEMVFKIEVPSILSSGTNFAIAALGAFIIFPRIFKQPFGDVSLAEYLRRLGFYFPKKLLAHIFLGVILAAFTLLGILAASLLTGRYELDWSTVSLSHTIFSINPGIWEEFFYRGIIMIVLLMATKSLMRAAVIQIVLFGLFHIKGFDVWAWVDVFSVMILAIAFTYAAYKTRTLVAGIVFHFLHDTFLFLPQVPGGDYSGALENIGFYVCLWLMTGVGILVIKLFADKLGVKADRELYVLEKSTVE